jgi:hypothetical protein
MAKNNDLRPEDFERVAKIIELKWEIDDLKEIIRGKDSYIVWLEKENEELKNKLSKREQGEFRYFWNDGETDIYEEVK